MTDVALQGALDVSPQQTAWTDDQLAVLRQMGVDDASPADLTVFLNYAQRTQLDPFARQIYMVGRFDAKTRRKRWTIQTSIDGARIIAQRSGDYAGQVGPEWCGLDGVWHDVWLSPQPPVAARVGVLRNGFSVPLYAVALFREYAGTTRDGGLTAMWSDKPALMIAKCAEALALRKAFPHDLSGLYTADEMTRADSVGAPAADSVRVQRATVTRGFEPQGDSTPPTDPGVPSPESFGSSGVGGGEAPTSLPPVDVETGEIIEDAEVVAPHEIHDSAGASRRAMFAAFHECAQAGLMPDTREHRLAITEYAVGRAIESSTQMDDSEVSRVLGVLDDLRTGVLLTDWRTLANGTPVFMGIVNRREGA